MFYFQLQVRSALFADELRKEEYKQNTNPRVGGGGNTAQFIEAGHSPVL